MDRTTYAERMEEARKHKKMGLKELRELVGVSRPTMGNYSAGKVMPPLDVAAKIADALGVSLDWLCGKDERQPIQPEYSMGHVARLFLELYSTNHVILHANDDGDVYQIQFDISEISEFFGHYMLCENVVADMPDAQEMLDAWLEKELTKLDKLPL